MRHFGTRKYHRRSTRLRGYDYSRNGLYFITICTHQRECIFGEIIDGEMRVNKIGQIVLETWNKLPYRFPDIQLDQFVVMPNHAHGIIHIVGAIHESPLPNAPMDHIQRRRMLLSKIIGYFKMNSAKQINLIRNTPAAPIWQRNYHDHIIRNERSLNIIRGYILQNPLQWDLDRNNPKNINSVPPPSPEPFRSDTSWYV
jgi:REP element-mobilizing transposase RayT